MPAGIAERLIVSVILLGALPIAWGTFLAVSRWRLRRQTAGGAALRAEGATVMYFWTDECAQCKPQERQIEEARAALGRDGRRVFVRKVNALESPALVKSMHVMTVPTTVILDGRGRVVAWNPGLTLAPRLLDQLVTAAALP